MVKRYLIIFLSVFLFGAVCFISGCSNDFFGLVYSNDLDERLNHKNYFPFLEGRHITGSSRDWKNLEINNESNYKFIVVTDTHIEDGNAFGFEYLTNAIILSHGAEFVVNLGDVTQHGSIHDIDRFIEIAEDMGVPVYPVIGNHDIYFNTWPVWRENIGSTNYRVDSNNTTLFVLDTANAFFGKHQLDWLENEIKTAKQNVFVFTHAPLFTTGIKMQQVTDTRERARIISILRNRADIMFMGHSHQRAINSAGNVQYVTFEDFKSTGIYCVVSVINGTASYEFWKLVNGVPVKL